MNVYRLSVWLTAMNRLLLQLFARMVYMSCLCISVVSIFGHCSAKGAPISGDDILSARFASGIFVAPEISSESTAQQWKSALKNMRDIGMDTVIIQYSFRSDSRGGHQAYFPYDEKDTKYDSAKYPLRRKQVKYILSAAKKVGIKVYLGLQISEYEWFEQDKYRNADWLKEQYLLSLDLANALWDEFGADYNDTIAGWYLPFEFESSEEYQLYFKQIADQYYDPLTSALKGNRQYKNLKIMISPLMYQTSDINAWQTAVKTVLSSSLIDIIAPQDGIGYGTQTHDSVGKWFAATKNAVDEVNATQSNKISLWGNCENYKRLENPKTANELDRNKPMSISKFITSMDTIAPYVDKIIVFSIHRWDSEMAESNLADVNSPYYEAYKRFYLTGNKSLNKAEGYYVDITAKKGEQLVFNKYAAAGLTDGFAVNPNDWSEYKGISTKSKSPFSMEILFDDPIKISKITSHYYKDSDAGIAFPKSVKYECLVRPNKNKFSYSLIRLNTHKLQSSNMMATFAAETEGGVAAEGIRITVYPNDEWTFIDDIFVE